jgi:dsDNA-specific endonuclease/ATPase MutS2
MKNKGKPQSLPLLDLHGYKTEDVADAVDRFIMTHSRKGTPRVRIMPGKGSGAVRKTLVEYLKLGGYPFENERMPNGEKNEGVLVVFLDD